MLNWIRKEIKSIVREAMDDWVKDVEYLTQPTNKDGRYYCSKSDCEGVRFPTPDEVSESTCLLYTSPSPRDGLLSRMPSSA